MIIKRANKALLIAISMLCVVSNASSQSWNPGHKIGPVTGKDHYAYNQVADQLVEIFPAGIPNTGLTYQWEQSTTPLSGFTAASGTSTQHSYSPGPVTQTIYYRRKTTNAQAQSIYSNVVKITLVSAGWEDMNYIRQHEVLKSGLSTALAIEQLPTGEKLEVTTYVDGLGRGAEKIVKEIATPADPNGLWGDMVQFSQYDINGRQPSGYLPYTTVTQPGKYKTTALTEQAQYYSNVYNETSPFSTVTFDNSPLNRVMNVKSPGTSWAAGAGKSAIYDINTVTDNVQMFEVDYIQGNPPLHKGVYPINTLYKMTSTDENGKEVVEYSDKGGKLILKKVQLDNVPANEYDGWICTYNVYDEFGLLRYQIQPEGVKYLSANGWSFAGTNGQLILNEQCFQYNYDDKARIIWKKSPGAQPLQMLYDIRDRVVFMQDGNQSLITPTAQWTANLYDELDRTVITTLYNTNKTVAQLKTDIANAVSNTTVTITNPGQSIVNLVVNQRDAGIATYRATTSIDFVTDAGGDFESLPGDDFTAEIDPAATSPSVNVTTTVLNNPISSTDLNNPAVCTVLKYLFYDTYSYATVKGFDNGFTNTTAYSAADPDVQPISKTARTIGMVTGSMTRVLGTATFLSATYYYDERGALVQNLEDNVKSGTDITTLQYHFDGRVLSNCNDHTIPGTGYVRYKTLTKLIFDKIGRVTSVQKKWGTNAFKTVSSYAYDDMGRLKTKHLDPNYTAGANTDLEYLDYSYNLHGLITGINKDYALKTPGKYDKWGHFFGLYLGFDNRDNVFTSANLTGQVTGLLWNTQGDDAQRKYDYTYDNAGRLVNAQFNEKQHTGDNWSNAQMDFSISGTSGKITYDLNGNLLNMLHKGVVPGTAAPITVDNLAYSYASYSNKLQSVTDQMANTAVNGKFGDFKDGTNTSTPDYVYDANGNLVIDLNKEVKDLAGVAGVNGIKYNFLDKPEQIRIAGKGTIKIVYSATGEKLQRSFTPEPTGAVITTTYINQFVYQETTGGTATLQFMNFEEGRVRIVTPFSEDNGLDGLAVDGNIDMPGGKRGALDYFIMDYQQNVRMILTEETHIGKNTATMESARAVLEESIFGQTGTGNEVAATRYDKPNTWTNTELGTKVSRLGTNAGHNTGPNTLQKVMAGDKLTAAVQYYHEGIAGGNNSNFTTTVLGSLVQAISGGGGVAGLVKDNATSITGQLSGVTGFINALQPGGNNPAGDRPQAYLTVLFFDERFNFIPAADGGVAQVQVAASVTADGDVLALTDIKAPKNGYAYVYISNQSNNHVYFDNFKVAVTAGRIIEENHYYAYGLKIATLCSKKLGDSHEGSLKNNYLYQGAYSELDEDIGWNDFALRNYDAQIGRWVQQDPFQEFASPYLSFGNDPVNLIDPSGGFTIAGLTKGGTVAVLTLGGAILGTAVGLISGDDDFTGTLIGAGVGLGAGLANLSLSIAIKAGIKSVNTAVNIMGSSINTQPSGTKLHGPNALPQEEPYQSVQLPGIDPLERLRILAAIAMGEGGNGWTFSVNELVEIAYVYINKEKKGLPLGDRSSYLSNNSVDFRMYMYILGSPKYANDQDAIKLSKVIPKSQKEETKAVYKELECYQIFRNSPKNIRSANNPNITIQGYHKDLNGMHGGKLFWNRVRWYVYYIYSGKIALTNNLYVLLGSDNGHVNATFLVDEAEVNKFYEKSKDWIDDKKAPIYDPKTNKFKE